MELLGGARPTLQRGYFILGSMIRGLVTLATLILVCAAAAKAQNVSGYFAGGTAIESAAGPIDTFGNGTLYDTPKMGGFFGTIGADFLFFHNEKIGIGGEYTFRKDRGPYAGLEYQPKFYDLNAVYQPLTFAHRFTPEFQLGAGRASLSVYDTLAACLKLPQGCAGENEQSVNINDLQIHAAAGMRFYAYRGIFVRPQVDVRWVRDSFSGYFGSPWVTQYSVAVGYTFHFRGGKSAKK